MGKKKKKQNEPVISKNEITGLGFIEKKDTRAESLKKYHADIREMGEKVEKFVTSLGVENLLSIKMGLMEAVRLVEERIKKNREEV